MPTAAEIRAQAQAHLRAGRAAEAAARLAAVLRRQPAPEVWNDWAFAREVQGNTSDAENGYLQALRMDVFQPRALGNLGRLWATQGHWRQAAPVLERAVALQGGAQAPAMLRKLAREARERERQALATHGGLHILFIHEHVPEADHNGADQRVTTLLAELQRLGHAVTFISRTGPGQESYLPALARVCARIYSMDAEMLRWRLDQPPAWTLDAVLAEGRFDVAIIAHWHWLGIACTEQYLLPIRQLSPHTRIIVLSEDHHGLLAEQRTALSGHWMDQERAWSISRRELDVYARADMVWAVSASDRAGILARGSGSRIEVLPPVAAVAPPGPGFAGRSDLVFLGAFLNPANTDGLDWFFATAWPEIRRRLPEVQLHLVGSDLPDRYREVPGVVCDGFVPDLAPVLARHRLAIAPIRFGTGAKTKGLAALAHGLPFVATPRGVDGLEMRDGDGALIADDPPSFAAAVLRLYQDQALWERLAAAGRAHAASHLSSARLSERIRQTLAAVLAAPPQPSRPIDSISPLWVEQRFPDVLAFQPASERLSYRLQRYLDLAEEDLAAGRVESAHHQCAHALIFVHPADAAWAARICGILDRIPRAQEPTPPAPDRGTGFSRKEPGAGSSLPTPPPSTPQRRTGGAGPRGTLGMPRLALSMIVRDAARDLPLCLASARGAVDEIVIADTGSRDETMAVAQEMGARVIEIPWHDDFAAARNAALEACQAEWILMLDADERLDPAAAPILHALMRQPESRLGYEAHIRNYVNSPVTRLFARAAQPNDHRLPEAARYPAFLVHENVRLFRRHPDIYFTGRVHETVARRIEALGQPIGPPSFIIHHFGLAADAATRQRKDRYYLELGRKKLAERPGDPRSHFELAIELFEHAQAPEEALALLEQACAMAPTFWLAWFYLGLARQRLGRHGPALEAFSRARTGGLDTAPLLAAMGEANYALGAFAAAARCFRRALKWQPKSSNIASQLALCEVRDGDAEAGLKRLRRVLRSEPANPSLQERLILALAWLGRTAEAAQAAENLLESGAAPAPRAYLRVASLWAREQQWPAAAAALRRGLDRFPAEPALRTAWSEVQPHLSPGLAQIPVPQP